MQRELKLYSDCKLEFSKDNGRATIVGYIPFYDPKDAGTSYEISRNITIRFSPEAFDKAIASGRKISTYYNHDSSAVVASNEAGTLSFTKFDKFLRYTANLNLADFDSERMYTKMVDKLVTGTSWGGYIEGDSWYSEDGKDINLVHEFDMYEVSPTSNPAFGASRAVIRAGEDDLKKSWNDWQSSVYDEKIKALGLNKV